MALDVSRPNVTQLDRVGDLFTLDAAARELGTTYWTLDRLIRNQHIATYSIGQARLVRLADIRPHL